MLWTVAVIADSAETLFELLVRQLTPDEKDALWADSVRFGELFGMPRTVAPPTCAEFRDYWDQMWTGGELHLTDEARAVALAVAFRIPMPRHMHPSREVHNLVLAGTLPDPVKRMFGVRWSRLHEAAYRSVVAGIRAGRPLAPERVRRGPNTSSFDLVSRTEPLARRGRPGNAAVAGRAGRLAA